MTMPEQKKAVVPRLRFPEFRDAGPWEVKRLGEVAEIYQPETIPLSSLSNNGEFLVYGANGIIGRFDCFNHEQPQIAVTCRGSTCGEVTLTRPRSWITGNSMVVNVDNSPGVIKGFLYFQLKGTNWNYLITGSGQPQITGEIKKHKVALPSLDEQQKIAECLSSLDELIELEAKKLEALQAHKKGLMQQLFPREGETTPRLRFPEFRDAGPWEVKRLGDVCDVLQGYGFPHRFQGKQRGKYPFCKVSDVTRAVVENGGHITSAANYIDEEDLLELRAQPLPPGTTIFARIGEALRSNNRAITDVSCVIDNNVGGLKALQDIAIDYFVFCLAQRIDLNEHCGGAVPSVNKTTIESIKVAIPGAGEQQKIADCLSSLDELIELEAKKLEALQTHKKGLMQQLFPQEIDL